MPLPLQFLTAWIGVWLGGQQQRTIEYVNAENRSLMEQLGGRRLAPQVSRSKSRSAPSGWMPLLTGSETRCGVRVSLVGGSRALHGMASPSTLLSRPHLPKMRGWLAAGFLATCVFAPAAAATTLTVDLSSTIGPVTHVGSGSLYGVTEKLPADVNGLIAPLHPKMFTNPAAAGAGKQQPVGDAIVVAGRVAAIGGQVTIRLADWFPGWPYGFTNMTDWFDKLGQTVTRKKASGTNNYYGYEIWNEPNGTWTNSSIAFNDFWKQSFVKLRQLDPGAKIIGPSISYYNSTYLKNFLTFAKANNCVPDIVSWHELSGSNLTSNFQSYRAMETQLGIGPLPISINEYSGKDHIDDEGMPGASAPIIAKLERFKIDSASITWWDVAHPGRLGSLLATDTAINGGWWFYKWYGDMSGNMVSTTPPAPNDPEALDGFANLDATAGRASVLFAGVNDGTVQVVVKGLQVATFLGSQVHAVVERTPFVSRSTVVTATSTVSTANLTVANNQIAVTVSGTNSTDGYRLSLSPVGGGSGGASGSGGSIGSGGMPGSGGSSGSGGAGGGSGGSSGSGGAGGGSGGTAGSGAGGARTGSGGTVGSGGVRVDAGGSGGVPDDGGSSGCSCQLEDSSVTPWLLLPFLIVVARRRGRTGRSSIAAS